MFSTGQTYLLPGTVWVKRRDSVRHSTRRQPRLHEGARGEGTRLLKSILDFSKDNHEGFVVGAQVIVKQHFTDHIVAFQPRLSRSRGVLPASTVGPAQASHKLQTCTQPQGTTGQQGSDGRLAGLGRKQHILEAGLVSRGAPLEPKINEAQGLFPRGA